MAVLSRVGIIGGATSLNDRPDKKIASFHRLDAARTLVLATLIVVAFAAAPYVWLLLSTGRAIYDNMFHGLITLRTHVIYVDARAQNGSKISIWQLKIPKDLNRTAFGAAIFNDFENKHRGDGGLFGVDIQGQIETDKTISKVENKKIYDPNRTILTGIDNGLLFLYGFRQPSIDYCYAKSDAADCDGCPDCDLCPVYYSFHGWNVSATVGKIGLYKSPLEVCSVLKKNLEAWTAFVDDLRKNDPSR